MIIIALVCSRLAVPDPANCVIDNSLRHEQLGVATSDVMCEFNGMAAAADHMHVNPDSEYLKVLCVRPLEGNRS